jgi:hypothetical protein
VRIVGTHEEPHLIGVPENHAPDKLVVVPAEAHRSVDPFGTSTLSFLLVTNSKSNSGPEEAIANLQNKMIFNSKTNKMVFQILVSFRFTNIRV